MNMKYAKFVNGVLTYAPSIITTKRGDTILNPKRLSYLQAGYKTLIDTPPAPPRGKSAALTRYDETYDTITAVYGADLLVTTATGTAVIQCKFYSHPVGYDAVKEAYTAKAIYKATTAYIVSNAASTTQARRAARQLGVTLANHAEIAALLR